jgi:hypothetical protein
LDGSRSRRCHHQLEALRGHRRRARTASTPRTTSPSR